jgi:hypothetical protein
MRVSLPLLSREAIKIQALRRNLGLVRSYTPVANSESKLTIKSNHVLETMLSVCYIRI